MTRISLLQDDIHGSRFVPRQLEMLVGPDTPNNPRVEGEKAHDVRQRRLTAIAPRRRGAGSHGASRPGDFDCISARRHAA